MLPQRGNSSNRIWVTRFIDYVRDRIVDHPLVLGCLTLGLVPVALTALFFALTVDSLTSGFIAAHLLAAVVPFVGPSAIWYWDVRVFPRFDEQTMDLAVNPEAVHQVTQHYKRVFSSRYLRFTVPWTATIVGIVALNIGYFETLGVTGPGDPAFWVYLLFAGWFGLLSGIGFHGAITAVRAIRAVGTLDMAIDPLHPDGVGGLSNVGYLAIWTTMLTSLGSLTLPLAFILGTEGGYNTVVYLAVGIYVIVIAVSFVYPTHYVNRRAQAIREAELEKRRSKIRKLQTHAKDFTELDGPTDQTATMDEMAKRLEIQRLRDEFNEYANVNLYPLSVDIVIRLVSSILLPIFFILFETGLGRLF